LSEKPLTYYTQSWKSPRRFEDSCVEAIYTETCNFQGRFQDEFLLKQSTLVTAVQLTAERVNNSQNFTSSALMEMPHPYFGHLLQQYREVL